MKFSINNRKSWFWHWFVMTSWRDRDRSVYELPILAKVKYKFPKYEVENNCPSYSTKYECSVFYRHRAIRSKNYTVYWGPYGGPQASNNIEA